MKFDNKEKVASAFIALYGDSEKSFTEDEIYQELSKLANNSGIVLTESELKSTARYVFEKINVFMDNGIHVIDSSSYTPWLDTRKDNIDFVFWDRYRKYLRVKKFWSAKSIGALGSITDTILDLLGDPANNTPWQRRGMIMGSVQSGKTATYTAICNKAIDAGYRVIIILTGVQENLRIQTQERLDLELVGVDSEIYLTKQRKQRIGVSEFSNEEYFVATFTSKLSDFKKATLVSNGLNIGQVKSPVLFVIKKQKDVLNALISWLRLNNLTKGSTTIDIPMLLIDDEADNASVNTNVQGGSPTVINSRIRELLTIFNRASYIGVTATPYANVFIDPDSEAEMIGNDLFPRDFIYSLSAPDDYIGYNQYFSENGQQSDRIIHINDAESFLPLKHKGDWDLSDLPPSLYEAIRYFLISCCIMDLRNVNLPHRSMLINFSRHIKIHESLTWLVESYLEEITGAVKIFGRAGMGKEHHSKAIRQIKETWDKYGFEDANSLKWEDFIVNLFPSISNVKAIEVNSGPRSNVASLNYSKAEKGLRLIVIGGNGLSRGLTLEGLTVSYFYRSSYNYDTLLQMGRWFGYRPGYSDLCRIWTSEELEECYIHIAQATDELRYQLQTMQRYNQTPKDFGLMIRTHPETADRMLRKLKITANNKMRSSEEYTFAVSYNGVLIETPRIPCDQASVIGNYQLAIDTLALLEKGSYRNNESEGSFVWRDVPKGIVTELVGSFISDPRHFAFIPDQVKNYILDNDGFEKWDVAVPTGSFEVNGELPAIGKIKIQNRIVDIDEARKAIRINRSKLRVGSRGCTKIGLPRQTIEKIEQEYAAANKGEVPDPAYLIEGRNPLLLIHLIKPNTKDGYSNPSLNELLQSMKEESFHLTALGIGFPRLGKKVMDTSITYKINVVKQQELFSITEDDGDTDDDY